MLPYTQCSGKCLKKRSKNLVHSEKKRAAECLPQKGYNEQRLDINKKNNGICLLFQFFFETGKLLL